MKNRLLSQCRLLAAVTALEDFGATSPVTAVPVAATLRTLETTGPASRLNGRFTLLLVAVLGEEFVQAHARLKLKAIHLHGVSSAESVPRYCGDSTRHL